MKAQTLHSWSVTASEARQIQQYLSSRIVVDNYIHDVRLVAGVDISGADAEGFAQAAVVVLSYPELKIIEVKAVKQKIIFPYVPGLLSFREAPLIVAVCEALDSEPDLILVDGQGIAHPRRFGLASHLGLLLDKPTIGCAKSRLCGGHDQVSLEPGSYTNLIHNDEVVGAVLRTRQGVAPMYISVGHKVDLQAAVSWALRCCKGFRIPEPTRLAHHVAGGKLIQTTLN